MEQETDNHTVTRTILDSTERWEPDAYFEEFSLPPLAALQQTKPANEVTELLFRDSSIELSTHESLIVPPSNGAKRLGRWGLLILIGGTLCILGALSVLCFLRFSDYHNQTWRRIALADWMTRSITVMSLLIRAAVAFQAALATSMIAALLLQWREVHLPQITAFFVIRAHNSGPQSLLWQTSFSRFSRKTTLSTVFLGTSAATTALSQFISTMLLSDVKVSRISNSPETTEVLYGFQSFTQSTGAPAYPLMRPSSFPTFAEYTEPAASVEGAQDTGLSLRALLPITSAERREKIQNYSGKATVVDNRVFCARPHFPDLRINPVAWMSPDLNLSMFAVSGHVEPEIFPTGFLEAKVEGWLINQPGNGSIMAFNCSTVVHSTEYNVSQAKTVATPPPVVCFVEPNLGFRSALYSNYTAKLHRSPNEQGQFVQTFLVIRTLGEFENRTQQHIETPTFDLKSIIDEEEWLNVPVEGTDIPVLSMSFSLCFASPVMRYMDVNATGGFNRTEPVLKWNVPEAKYDAASVRHQLGATPEKLSLDDRGVLQMVRRNIWNPNESFSLHEPVYRMHHGNLTVTLYSTSLIAFFGRHNFSLVMYVDSSVCNSAGTTYDPSFAMVANVHQS